MKLSGVSTGGECQAAKSASTFHCHGDVNGRLTFNLDPGRIRRDIAVPPLERFAYPGLLRQLLERFNRDSSVEGQGITTLIAAVLPLSCP